MEAVAKGNRSAPRIQFSRAATCTPQVFEQLEQCCQRFGARIVVRFFGFYHEEFDVEILRRLPSVRALYIDVRQARNLESLGQLKHLEDFGIGVHHADYPDILQNPGIQSVERLVLINNLRNNVDLAPLATFSNLADLTLCAQARHIEVLGELDSIRRLALNQMSKSVHFAWIQSMTGLRDLTILLGSRASIDEVSHGQLERLRIDRVRGLEKINLAPFPLLTHFHMEDQLKVRALDFSQLSTSLRSITVWNCKSREELVGIEAMTALEFLWIGKTRIDPEHIVKRLPACLRQATFAGYGKKRDASISAIIESQGVTPAAYGGQLTG